MSERVRRRTDCWWFRVLVGIGLQRDLLDLFDPDGFMPGLSRGLDLWIHILKCTDLYIESWPTWGLTGVSRLVVKVLKLQACFLQGALYLKWYYFW